MNSGRFSDELVLQGSLSGGSLSFSQDTSVSQDPSGPDTHVFERPGTVIGGRYRIDAPVAHGGMGVVYRATQLDLERQVAIKAMSSDDRNLLERFRREAIAMADVAHPAVVDVYDFVPVFTSSGGRLYLVMAFIEGQDLRSYVRSQPERRLPASEVVELMLPVVSALVELHDKGVIHRDLKPSNLMRTARTDGRPYLRLVDFGIARRHVDPALTAAGSILGTPTYMAPETLVGEKETARSDIYSLGATLFHLISGKPPRKRGSPRRMVRRMMRQPVQMPEGLVDTPLGELLTAMLQVGASERPDALDVLRRLEEIHRTHVAGTVFERADLARLSPWGPVAWSESGPLDTGVTTQVDSEPAPDAAVPLEAEAEAEADVDDDDDDDDDEAHIDDEAGLGLERAARPPTGSFPLHVASDPVVPAPVDPTLDPALERAVTGARGSSRERLIRGATLACVVGATLAGVVVLLCLWQLV